MFPVWWGNKKENKLCFSDFLTGRTTKSPAISLNRIFIHVRFLFEHVKLRLIIIIGGTNEICSACSNNRENTNYSGLYLYKH